MNEMSNYPCPLKPAGAESDETLGILVDYVSRKLDPVRTQMLEQHMMTCLECARFRDEQTAVWNALDSWEPAPVSADFNRRLWHRIDEASGAPWYTAAGWRNFVRQLQNATWQPAVPLTAAVLVVACGFLLDQAGPKYKTYPAAASVSDSSRVTISEADQVERTLDDIQLLNQFESSTAEGDQPAKIM